MTHLDDDWHLLYQHNKLKMQLAVIQLELHKVMESSQIYQFEVMFQAP